MADLGAGEGLLSELLARRCKKVIAVDNSEKIVAFGAAKAKKNGLKNLEFRLGDLQNPPIEPNSVDLVILSQALHHAEDPGGGDCRARTKSSSPRGQILILDLLKHNFEKARELYGDRWLGFAESDLHRWLEDAGFKKIEISVVAARGTAAAFPDDSGGRGKSVAASSAESRKFSELLLGGFLPKAAHATIRFTSFFGTTMTFLIVLPAMNCCTFSDALAAASSAALSALAGTLMTSRSLPFTCTGISSSSLDEQRRIKLRPGRVGETDWM